MKYRIAANLLKAVLSARARADPARWYLYGTFVDVKQHCIVAASGPLLCRAPLTLVEQAPCRIQTLDSLQGVLFRGPSDIISAKGDLVLDLKGMCLEGPDTFYKLEILDSDKFPDYRKFFTENLESKEFQTLGLYNPSILTRVLRAAKISDHDMVISQVPIYSPGGVSHNYLIKPYTSDDNFNRLDIVLAPCKKREK